MAQDRHGDATRRLDPVDTLLGFHVEKLNR
jgi:hypothetical protein